MTVYLDVLFLSLFLCTFWITRFTVLCLRIYVTWKKQAAISCLLAFLQCLLLSFGLLSGFFGRLLWDALVFLLTIGLLSVLLARRIPKKKWSVALAVFSSSVLYGCVMQGTSLLLGVSLEKLSTINFWLLLNAVGLAGFFLLRLFCAYIWRQKLSYGVILMLQEKHYFFRGYCDTGNFLKDERRQGVFVLEKGRFEQMKAWNPACSGSIVFTSASGKQERLETIEVERVRLTASSGSVLELTHVTVAKGGVFFRQPYDILLPSDIVWKS